MAAGYTKNAINQQLKQICAELNIEHKRDFVTVTKPYRFRVEFHNEQHLTMFALKWQVKNSYFAFTVKHDDINSDIQPSIVLRGS